MNAQAKSRPHWLTYLDIFTGVIFITAALIVFFFTPVERVMGPVQKVFYFHVAAGWVGMSGFLVAFVCGIGYLRSARRLWDLVAVSAIEIGLVFTMANLVTGMVWARPIWNTWWTWDPRLTTAAVMELVYVAYLMLRQGLDEPERRARFGSVYAILGFLSVPLTFISVRMFRTIHPVVIGSEGASTSFLMTPGMQVTFFFSLFTFTVLFITLLIHRVRLAQFAERLETLRLKLIQ